MKIAIVGCGLAGMSSYLALRKFLPGDHEVTIYESHAPEPGRDPLADDLDSSKGVAPQGGVIGISANGMRVLHSLDPAIHATIKQRGFAYETIRLRSSSGFDLAVESRSQREDDSTMIMARQITWGTLREAIPDDDVVIRKVLKVTKRGQSGNSKPLISFADGGSAEFDLVVGADGVHSTVRKQFFGAQGADYSAVFSAYRPTKDDSLTWWSLYETKEPPSKKEVPREFVSTMLQNMYGDWKEENVQEVLKKATAPFIYPIWTVPELPTWGDGGVVLVGDAAHAMTPDIGQGTSQAFEDSEALGLILGRALQQKDIPEATAVDLTVKGLYECRLPRLTKIKHLNAEAQTHSGRRNFWVQKLIFFCIWIMPSFTWLRDMIYGSGHRTDEILFGWDADAEARKVVEKSRAF
ncbi:hypothetical protein AK830_g931 [Neonectria ditissima]|uniref:FAD-binding domain-containing protein n=1 Tax=Neonectria ditissima TaxID=78410 RepID=A0A0P7BVS7_9HYPO|nr:hypothetical protein AK830_g931 [Neonectria ditissima]